MDVRLIVVVIGLFELVAVGCGRISFDSGDACLAMDTDCVTTCGDSRCVGNAGENCSGCAADCAGGFIGCGDGACAPSIGEDSETCYEDCGPTPWTWESHEVSFVAQINAYRTAGTMCPGGPAPPVPALVRVTSLDLGAREWAWEVSHQGLSGTDACNGRTNADRLAAAGASSVWQLWVAGAANATDAVDFLIGNPAACPGFMSNVFTRIGVGAVVNGNNWFFVFLDK